jgi:Protein of unknown function (DUF2695)
MCRSAGVAQLVELRSCKAVVVGSSPTSGSNVDKPSKKELKRRARAQREAAAETEWREQMILQPEQLMALLDHLDQQLPGAGCDHTLRLTRRWATDHEIDGERLAESLSHFGGGCDCEVLANLDPETQVAGWPTYRARFG